jgi:hypothetical protein
MHPAPVLLPRARETSSHGSYERDIGSKVATCVAALCRGILEYRGGRVSRETLHEGSELLAELAKFKMVVPEFDAIARTHGAQLLREYVAAPPDPMAPDEKLIAQLIEETLNLLTGLVKLKTN